MMNNLSYLLLMSYSFEAIFVVFHIWCLKILHILAYKEQLKISSYILKEGLFGHLGLQVLIWGK